MILFLSFAPIQYLGGAERKIYELYLNTNKKEKSYIMTMDKKIANVYGKLVLNQTFEDRSKGKLKLNNKNSLQLRLKHFIPFSTWWTEVRNIIVDARIIYVKSELAEFLILLYYGRMNVLKKVIAGVRSPLIYHTPKNTWDKLHNALYQSEFFKQILYRTKSIHVLNKRDKKFFEEKFKLSNIIHIPNYIEMPNLNMLSRVKRDKKELRIIFIGELLSRKGVDMLIKVIENSPKNYQFDIVGDGPLKKQITAITKKYSNSKYHGYLNKNEINVLLNNNDVLFFPSLAEGFGNVIIEAMSFGLKVVDSKNVSLDLPKNMEYSLKYDDYKGYMKVFENIYTQKKSNVHNRVKIRQYCSKMFKTDKIMPQLLDQLFDLEVTNIKNYQTL